MLKFIRKAAAAARVGWHAEHMMKVATDPKYAHVKFPNPVRVGKNTVAFVESEIDAWMEQRVAERDDEGFVPKASNPRENARRARERAEPAK